MLRRSHVVALSVLAAAAAILVAYFAFPAVFERPRTIVSGIADVGGPFTLTAHTGERVSDKAFRGQFMLVVFGFTHCPDVCPAELQVMTAALESMGAADRVQPLFITIDPERDTAARLADYMSHFHPRLLGLTGSADEIANIADAYHVWYEKVQEDGSADYAMDHTSIMYLMGPDGEFVQHFSFGTSAETLAKALRTAVNS